MERKKEVCEVCGEVMTVVRYSSSSGDQQAVLEAEIENVRRMASYSRKMAKAGESEVPDAREGLRRVCDLCDSIMDHATAMLAQEISDQDRMDAYSLLQRIATVFDDLGFRFQGPSDQSAALKGSIEEVMETARARLREMASEQESGCLSAHDGLKRLLEGSGFVLDSALVVLSLEVGYADRHHAFTLMDLIGNVFDDLGVKILEEGDEDEEGD